jgi:two-component system, sensor histidine kinase and response regulator
MPPQGPRILLVDDVDDNLFLLQTILESEGYLIDVANNGALALEIMKTTPPDLVLLDVMMPELDGYELTRKIRRDAQLHAIPVVLITAHVEACRIKGLAVGATDFIRKPVDFEEVILRVATILKHSVDQSPQDFLFSPAKSIY